jgi:CBS domain-containing protein
MLRVQDIMTPNPLTISAGATVREAMELLSVNHVSGAPVMDGGVLAGVVSASDLMVFASQLSGVPTERDPNQGWIESADAAIDEEVDQEAEAASAFFSELWDDAGAGLSSRFDNVSSPEWNDLEEHDVSEVMTRAPLETLPSSAPAEAAAARMAEKRIHRVLETDGHRLVGIITASDITRAVAEHRFIEHPWRKS